MFNFLFSDKKDDKNINSQSLAKVEPSIVNDDGIWFPPFTSDDLIKGGGKSRSLIAYLMQLEEEGYLRLINEKFLLPWEQLFALLSDDDHTDSLSLLDLPEERKVCPMLCSEGGLSDANFKIYISGWRSVSGNEVGSSLSREGAFFNLEGIQYRMPKETWSVLQAIKQFSRDQIKNTGEAINQIGWADIHKKALAAGAYFDGFLDRTVVVRPDSLRLKLKKSEQKGLHVLEVVPEFENAPEGWLDSFDRIKAVPDHYTIPSVNGGITHVLIAPEVKTVLQEIRSLPARRVAGDKALQLLRNPYACLGDDATKVLNYEQFEKDREESGFSFLRFSLNPVFDPNLKISSIILNLDSISQAEMEPVHIIFNSSSEFAPFVNELQIKLASGLICGFWKGYELELSDFTQVELDGIELLLSRWRKEESAGVFEGIFDLTSYGGRVIGIGAPQTLTSPYLAESSGQQWLPADLLTEMGLDGALLAQWDTDNPELLKQFQSDIASAKEQEIPTVTVPGLGATLPIKTAEVVAIMWADKLKPAKTKGEPNSPNTERSVLQIDDNIDKLGYIVSRATTLQFKPTTPPILPSSLLPTVKIRDHQKHGIAWLQNLLEKAPVHVSGCLLADDMGLGKTLQLLTVIAQYLESNEKHDPVLIIAPVSLLDNWESEMRRFFKKDFATVLKLYGSELSSLKFAKSQLPKEVTDRGIFNLLKPNWRQGRQIVLTTYETLRDQEFSLARQHWSIVVCDEAQKIKNPSALVTTAAKALPATFKIACTGTPVENSLTDLWCLFEFIQPGLLGTLNLFGKKYRQPADAVTEIDQKALNELRTLIEPQILRRLKTDVAKDLPLKTESNDCMSLPMSASQLRIYKSEIAHFQATKTMAEKAGGNKSITILGLLHTMKMICAHPHSIFPEGELLDVSPKMRWLMQELKRIKDLNEKVIIFTELRDIQRALQLTILDHFNINVTVVNGDTNTSSERGPSRQGLIDLFQSKPGFGVIILSTTAVGFGVNVQAANHVIHFTRCWNPAKEDQATDRAYRIGQTKEVFVYYPTITTDEFESFEQKLDNLLTRKRVLARDMLNGAGDINLMDLASN